MPWSYKSAGFPDQSAWMYCPLWLPPRSPNVTMFGFLWRLRPSSRLPASLLSFTKYSSRFISLRELQTTMALTTTIHGYHELPLVLGFASRRSNGNAFVRNDSSQTWHGLGMSSIVGHQLLGSQTPSPHCSPGVTLRLQCRLGMGEASSGRLFRVKWMRRAVLSCMFPSSRQNVYSNHQEQQNQCDYLWP